MIKGSYLILDEYIRFLNKGNREEKASKSILDINVRKAMTQVRWERIAFIERGRFYNWIKANKAVYGSSGEKAKELEW